MTTHSVNRWSRASRRVAAWVVPVVGAALAARLAAVPQPPLQPVPVRVTHDADGWHLERGGQPYFIKGVGGDASRSLLVECGGNSIRTWGAAGLEPQLDEAQRLGLTVAVGIWLGHKRHGFDYHDEQAVKAQLEKARAAIRRYRNHPAVLMWGIGNEMEVYEPAGDTAVYHAIEDIAAMAREEDPNHPTMTVIADIGGDKVQRINELCPHIEVLGINSYGGGPTLLERYRKAGGVKPYVVTEFGPPGTWEVKLLPIGAAPELSSTEKARCYSATYARSIAGAKELCLGSYAFIWGAKREATATWFGLLLPDGTRLAAVDALSEAWTGKPVKHPCPVIRALTRDGGDGPVDANATVRVRLDAVPGGVDASPIEVSWELRRDWFKYETGGDVMPEAPAFPEAIVKADASGCELKMPAEGGGYRLYATVRDTKGGGAIANLPFLVNGPAPKPRPRRAVLPLVVVAEPGGHQPYVPSGWMGNTGAIDYQSDCREQPHGGETCARCTYGDGGGWGGIVWQSPANDWGDQPGGFNLTGATKLVIWARGARGGERVTFTFGVIKQDKPFHDSAGGSLTVELTPAWHPYTIYLDGKDLSCIKTGFGWSVSGQGKPVTFYLDDVAYTSET